MPDKIKRREFIGRAAGAAVGLGIGAAGAQAETPAPLSQAAAAAPAAAQDPAAVWTPKRAFLYDMLPGNLSVEDRFKLVRDVGFDGVEAPPINDPAQCDRMRTAAANAGVRVHSVIYGGWDAPLSDPDPAVRARGLKAAEAAIQSAHDLGADDILLVPAIVTQKTRYIEAYQRSQKYVRELIPTAERLNILILIEEVWNKFLLSPLEYARYIDEFRSPWVHSYFDVGNVVDFGWPEDWIRTVGPRIRRVHLKDFKRGPRQFVNLWDGDVDWHEVRRAFMEVGYHGFMTTELSGGDEPYLKDLAARVDKFVAGV